SRRQERHQRWRAIRSSRLLRQTARSIDRLSCHHAAPIPPRRYRAFPSSAYVPVCRRNRGSRSSASPHTSCSASRPHREIPVRCSSGWIGNEHHSALWGIHEYVRSVGMRGQNFVQRRRAQLTGGGELGSNVVHQFICFVIDLLLRDGQHLAVFALEGGFHGTVALNVPHMPDAEDHKGSGG